jgi:hypothetical protein
MPHFGNLGSRKSIRLGIKSTAAPESEFPLLVRGFDSEKVKEGEYVKKKSIKDAFYRQNSSDEDKVEGQYKGDSNAKSPDSIDDEESDDALNVKLNSFIHQEESGSFLVALATPAETSFRLFDISVLQRVLHSEEPGENHSLRRSGFRIRKKKLCLLIQLWKPWTLQNKSVANFKTETLS